MHPSHKKVLIHRNRTGLKKEDREQMKIITCTHSCIRSVSGGQMMFSPHQGKHE